MTKQDAVGYFGTQQRLATALAITQAAVAQWAEIPLDHQNYLEKLTRGKLKAAPHPAERKAS